MTHHRFAALAFGLLVAAAVAAVDATPASGDLPSPLIAFTSDRDGNSEIYVVDSAGGTPVNLTNNPASDHSPTWSHDGRQIAFISDRSGNPDIWIMNADGSNPVNRTNTAHEAESGPAYSRDGWRIAYSKSMDWSWVPAGNCVDSTGASAIFTVPGTRGVEARLSTPYWDPVFESGYCVDPNVVTFSHEAEDFHPAWSPDGATIAFVRDFAAPRSSRLYTVDASTSGGWFAWVDIRNLGPPIALSEGSWDASGLDWSPDGATIVWSEASADNASATLRRISVATGAIADLVVPLAFTHYTDPAYAWEGAWLAFSAYTPDGERPDIYVWPSDGSAAPRRLTTDPAADTQPAWQHAVPPRVMGAVSTERGFWELRQGSADARFYYGNPGDAPFVGDWDCDGIDTPGLYRQRDGFAYLRNSNTEGIADIRFFFGDPSDAPLVGDFDGDGCDTVGVYRPSEQRFYIINELGRDEGGLGPADFSFDFGNPGDQPVVGDWDGDGSDEIGLHRPSTGLFYWRNTLTAGVADGQIYFGDPGDVFVAWDWDGDGDDTPAVYRPSTGAFYFRNSLTPGVADWVFFDLPLHGVPLAGAFGLVIG